MSTNTIARMEPASQRERTPAQLAWREGYLSEWAKAAGTVATLPPEIAGRVWQVVENNQHFPRLPDAENDLNDAWECGRCAAWDEIEDWLVPVVFVARFGGRRERRGRAPEMSTVVAELLPAHHGRRHGRGQPRQANAPPAAEISTHALDAALIRGEA